MSRGRQEPAPGSNRGNRCAAGQRPGLYRHANAAPKILHAQDWHAEIPFVAYLVPNSKPNAPLPNVREIFDATKIYQESYVTFPKQT